MRARLIALMAALGVLAAVVVGRAALVQLGPDARLSALARRQFESRVLIRPPRGTIMDRNGEPLAVNVEASSLAANPAKLGNRHNLARILAKATDVPYAKILQRLGEKKEFVWIKRQMSENDLKKLQTWHLMDASGALAAGLWLVKESRRVYPHGELASQILGSVDVDSDGLEGIELWKNASLQGKVVSVRAVRDALGRPAFLDAVAAKHARDGESVMLTIDNSLQYAAEEELRQSVHRTGARAGTVIAMNATTGELLAMANFPAGDATHRRNRAVTDGYEPGSTIKPVLAASALSHGWKLTDQVWGERGKFLVQGHRIAEAEAKEKFEWLSLAKILKVSSNVGAAKVALKLGADKYLETLRAFGFASKTDLGFPGEISGTLPPRRSWQPLTLANVGFGQGLLVTPLQMTRAYAAILNGGWLVQPSLIKSDNNSKRDAPKRILPQKICDQLIAAMEAVTGEGGTGAKAALDGYRVAGKTGTAQVVDPETHAYSRSRHIASFIGFAAGVEPKVVVFASLDDPKGAYFAAETAAPLFHEVLNAVASRFGLPASVSAPQLAARTTDRISISQAHSEPVPAAPAALEFAGMTTSGISLWKLPSLKGLAPREAVRALVGHRFKLEMVGSGFVQSQSPEEGKPVAEGDRVRIVLAEP